METKIQNKLHTPIVLQRDAHNVSRSNICEPALKVLYRLKKAGYDAYLVGGGVRDLLLERHPKDFDIATDALPEDAGQLFRNSRLIGRRFRLVHVHFGKDIIEVATFRGHENDSEDDAPRDRHTRDGMLIRDNVFGTIEEDAWRRDFTINALYYNIQDFTIIDYTGGLEDLNNRLIRIIGDPKQRYREDPVRMLRAARFAGKLGFNIEAETEAPIYELADRLTQVPPARLFEEVLKLFLSGHAVATYDLLRKYTLFDKLFPFTAALLNPEHPASDDVDALIRLGLTNTDARIAQGKPVTPAFLFAIMLWRPMQNLAEQYIVDGARPLQAHQQAGAEIIAQQVGFVSLPKRFGIQTREIWSLQPRLHNRSGKRAYRLLSLPRFRAGYDFLLLRGESVEPDLLPLCNWWTEFQEVSDSSRATMLKKVQGPRRRGRRPRKKRSSS
ncbi:polynucleotide adenylyltransferase PcnB [Kaarinaea lacus]